MPHDYSELIARHTDAFAANRARWDESVPIHVASEGYDMVGFLRGEKTLAPVELAEMGDVRGRTLLHLQCHFGMDTLNWARLGAKVTGLDFSEPAIERARELAATIGIADARFVQANVYEASTVLAPTFDIVYTGIGALCWLPDIRAWARVVASLLEPGGFLYLYDGHPMLFSIDETRADGLLVVGYPYFETPDGIELSNETTYVDGPPLKNQRNVEWNHGLGEVVTALIDAGLRIEFLHEHRDALWQALPAMIPSSQPVPGSRHDSRSTWRLPPGNEDLLPAMYSLKATKLA
jgi:SAM-dependent methyltransferase